MYYHLQRWLWVNFALKFELGNIRNLKISFVLRYYLWHTILLLCFFKPFPVSFVKLLNIFPLGFILLQNVKLLEFISIQCARDILHNLQLVWL